MKCYLVNGKGIDALKLAEKDDPKVIQPLDVLVQVKACSLNYRDLLVAKGLYGNASFPDFIALSDMSGVVVEAGPLVKEFKPGDRVLNAPFKHWPAGQMRSDWARTFVGGAGVDGVLAEKVVYPADALIKVPDYLNFIEASTFTIAGLTAWSAIVTHGKTRPGEWVLIHGTGGVSIFAAQIAHMLGARIILTTSSLSKGEFVKNKMGIHTTFDYRNSEWPQKVKEITGRGVDVVVEVAGGESLNQSLKACNYGARISLIGVLGGFESKINTMDIIHHLISIKGIYMDSTDELRAFTRAMDAAKTTPYIDKVFSFDQTKAAYKHLESQKHIGKVVITF